MRRPCGSEFWKIWPRRLWLIRSSVAWKRIAALACSSHRPSQAPGLGLDCADCEIKSLSICDALEPDEFEALERIGRTQAYPAKTTIFEQGRDAGFVFNLTSGALRLSKLLPDGRRQVVGFAMPGDFLGLALQKTHMFTADALTPGEALPVFARRLFRPARREAPPVAGADGFRLARTVAGAGPDGGAGPPHGGREDRRLPGRACASATPASTVPPSMSPCR